MGANERDTTLLLSIWWGGEACNKTLLNMFDMCHTQSEVDPMLKISLQELKETSGVSWTHEYPRFGFHVLADEFIKAKLSQPIVL